ncbi:MAG: ImmA/IrrE family metallo-endopeptidase [Anaerolineales bacterium]|nr:ImmA/IrrE family metallo-endopeptidase [Anaerolineales bacterium]
MPARVLAEHLEVVVVGLNGVPGISSDIKHQLLVIDPDSWSATTIVHNGCIVVIHNTAHSPRRQESNLMHELAHVLCKHHPSHMIQSGALPFALRTYDKEQEEEAGWLGGCLQLPRPALLWAIERGMTERAILDHFGTSQDLFRYRRRLTGVDVQLKRRTRHNG